MNRFPLAAAAMPLPLVLGACANTGARYTPIVDGSPTPGFRTDLAACQTLAREQFRGEAAGAALLGAGVGVIAGLAQDDVSDTEGAVGGAMVGALTGGVAGSVSTADRREAIVVSCMRGRGHRVVG